MATTTTHSNFMPGEQTIPSLQQRISEFERGRVGLLQSLLDSEVKRVRYEKALIELAALGGGRSEGNCIAQQALKE